MKSTKTKAKITLPLVKASIGYAVVGIGASAGGLEAFSRMLKAIPEDSGLAYVLVQHLSPNHVSLLPEILQKVTRIPILEITDVMKVQPDHVYIIPENKLLVANDGVLQLIPRPPKKKNTVNLPIDLFFNSLAQVHQGNAVGVVLSGTASDGTQGLKAIKDYGGITFAQDEASASYHGMPHSAIEAGVVDFILPPEKIPEKILAVTKMINSDEQTIHPKDEEGFRQILSVLRIRKGTDFTYYKQTTVRRRILRRMAFNKKENPAAYLKYLRENKAEQDLLYQDILIPVTSFFRDKSLENIGETVFSHILKLNANAEPIRVWVAGCSTGEETYSVAIWLRELLGGKAEKVQVFASDISEPAIIKARTGIYSKTQVEGVNPQQLQEFFTKTNGSYQVNKSIRDMCVFAVHNFLKDPPFGKLDFISCRNVLIYMEPYLQKKALTTFHYALKNGGFLLLGKSETTSSVPNLFTPVVNNDKLFTRKDVAGKFMIVASQRSEQNLNDSNAMLKKESPRTDFPKIADEIILGRFSPAGVVVNEAMDIVHFRGNTANYLEQTPGKPTHNLLKMAKLGLPFELRNILHKAKKENSISIKENISVKINGNKQTITIEAIPLNNTIEPHYLILFHETIHSKLSVASPKTFLKLKKDEKDIYIQQLEAELAQSREDMRSITEEQEVANEELQSANEELLSSNEELQSLNEELETAKEELQSINEELIVVNNELVSFNELVTRERNFSDAIIDNLHEPLLVLDNKLRIKNCNQAFYKTFFVTEAETEGKVIYELESGQWDIPELRTLLEKTLPQKKRLTAFEITHHFFKRGLRTMVLNVQQIVKENNAERIILLAIEDITESQLAKEKLEDKNEELEKMNKELQSFSYIASHDLQEPLRKIQTFATKLLEKEIPNLSDTGKDYFQRMQNAAGRMQTLIEDLLSFSRISGKERKFEIADIGEIIEDVRKDFTEIVEKKQAVIEVNETCSAKLIPFQFRQLMQNLIYNALKFSKHDIPPHIIITSSIVKGDTVNVKKLLPGKKYCHITIEDNGIGFEPEFNERVFEIFQRLHGKDKYPGTGIGLAIVKKIVDNHNGVITAKGELNKGATFDIYIPKS